MKYYSILYGHVFVMLQTVEPDQHVCYQMNRVMRKPVFGVSDQVRHKPGCSTTGNG